MKTNVLYYGDNLIWIQNHDYFPSESVDLIYLDPPFNSNADYNIIFKESSGEESQAQLRAFDDTWKWDNEASAMAINELSVNAPEIAEFIVWLGSRKDKLSQSMAAYLGMMSTRLLEMYRVLKPTGSLYLHCDPTASHYIKLMLDTIFGAKNFRHEIIWKCTSAHSNIRTYGNIHQTIFFYSKSDKFTFNIHYTPYDQEYIERYYHYQDSDGRKFMSGDLVGHKGVNPEYEWRGITRPWRYPKQRLDELDAQGRLFWTKNKFPRYKRYLDEMPGMPAQTIWTDILPVVSWSKEGLGYPTQKPAALLERVIQASSNESDVVLDPFCGCGTTLVAAHKLNRRWIGIDITHLSIYLVEQRLVDSFGESIKDTYEIKGNPTDVPSAQRLWNKDTKEFELWAIRLVGARPRAKDGGVDGILGFVDKDGKIQKVLVQVKGGETLVPSIVRDLIGTVKKEKAAIGLLICLHEPTKGMVADAVHSEPYKSELWNSSFPSIQIRTIKEILEGKQFELPPQISALQKAERIKERGETAQLI